MLWGNVDGPTGNNKPKYANTSNLTSNSSTHGYLIANTNAGYGVVFGVDVTEKGTSEGQRIAHPGWVSQKTGTGPIIGVALINGGSGYNSGGYLTVTDTSIYGKGDEANISFTIANTRNTLQNYSENAEWNVVHTIVVNAGGSLYSDSDQVELSFPDTPITEASYTIVLGGRGDRKNYETLVAMGSMTGDDIADSSTFVSPPS
jgi:hypothetical protein